MANIVISIAQLAQHWRCTEEDIYDLADRGELQITKADAPYRIQLEDLETPDSRTSDSRNTVRGLRLSVSQLSKRWQCSQRHVYNLVDRGELPAIRVGELIRFSRESIEEYERRGSPIKTKPIEPPVEAVVASADSTTQDQRPGWLARQKYEAKAASQRGHTAGLKIAAKRNKSK